MAIGMDGSDALYSERARLTSVWSQSRMGRLGHGAGLCLGL